MERGDIEGGITTEVDRRSGGGSRAATCAKAELWLTNLGKWCEVVFVSQGGSAVRLCRY